MKIRAVSLDSYCESNVTHPTFVKIDVEGNEWNVVKGGRSLFERYKPDVFVEVYSDETNKRRIWDFFNSLSYRIFHIPPTCLPWIHSIPTFESFVDAGHDCTNADFMIVSETGLADALLDMCTGSPGRVLNTTA
jgi:hypothetical protein